MFYIWSIHFTVHPLSTPFLFQYRDVASTWVTFPRNVCPVRVCQRESLASYPHYVTPHTYFPNYMKKCFCANGFHVISSGHVPFYNKVGCNELTSTNYSWIQRWLSVIWFRTSPAIGLVSVQSVNIGAVARLQRPTVLPHANHAASPPYNPPVHTLVNCL